MPELPEVEVTKRGIAGVLLNHVITDIFKGEKALREPMSPELVTLKGKSIVSVERRAKYIIIRTDGPALIIHLGMTGHMQIIQSSKPRVLHDHFEIMLDSGMSVRYNDTRRFGLVHFVPEGEDPFESPLLKNLGPEPFDPSLDAAELLRRLSRRSCSVKQAIMDPKVLVGVGNIYASETLFLSRILPERKANSLSEAEAECLLKNIREVLSESIASGGTTIRDFEGADGKPGYFVQKLKVYGHAGEKCPVCGNAIHSIVLGGRSAFFCPVCQH